FLIGDARLALRVSNAVAIGMLFVCGYAFGRCAGFRPWATGLGWSPSVRRWSSLRSPWEDESRRPRQRGSVTGLAGLGSPGLRSAASTENVTYAVHPSS